MQKKIGTGSRETDKNGKKENDKIASAPEFYANLLKETETA